MLAVFKREMKAYFTSPIGYIIIAAMYALSAWMFIDALSYGSNPMDYLFTFMFILALLIIPFITMRLMSEEKKLKTDQLLFTSPISLGKLVIGKYLASFVMYLISISCMLIYVIIVAAYSVPNWNTFLGNMLALILVGAAMLAIGLFISSITESQLISAVVTLVVSLAILFVVDTLASSLPDWLAFLKPVFEGISFMTRYTDLTSGIMNVAHIIFFLSFVVVFNFLSIRVLERKRWS